MVVVYCCGALWPLSIGMVADSRTLHPPSDVLLLQPLWWFGQYDDWRRRRWQVIGCWGVGAEAEFVENRPAEVDELKIFVFGCVGDGGAKSAEAEAAMTPAV